MNKKKKILTDEESLELKRQKYFSESGFLTELISSKYKDAPFENIHSYLVKIKKGFVRAKHYHLKKKEWITAVWGKTELKLKNTETGQTKEHLPHWIQFSDFHSGTITAMLRFSY